MMKFFGYVFAIALILAIPTFAQTRSRPKARAAKKPAKPVKQPNNDAVVGRTYTNTSLGFGVTFPNTWLIPGDDFEAEMKKAGYDLSLKAPTNMGSASRSRIDQALKNVTIVLTAYRSMPGSADNAIVRISIEDLRPNPQIKDAIDYFDAMRVQFRSLTLPADFEYSETKAEQLGKWQFAYLDSSSKAGKKRLYATVRKGYAILFSLSYTKVEDLEMLRQVLKDGDFALR